MPAETFNLEFPQKLPWRILVEVDQESTSKVVVSVQDTQNTYSESRELGPGGFHDFRWSPTPNRLIRTIRIVPVEWGVAVGDYTWWRETKS